MSNYSIAESIKYVEDLMTKLQKKRIICYGAKESFRNFVNKYCYNNLLPMPAYVVDKNHELVGSSILNVPVVTPNALLNEDPTEVFIIITSTDGDVLLAIAKDLRNMGAWYFQYTSLLALETYSTFSERVDEVDKMVSLLSDDMSKYLYTALISNKLYGCYHMPHLMSAGWYFENDVIASITDMERIIICGAYDGKTIERAVKQNIDIMIHAFEPNSISFSQLFDKFKSNSKVVMHSKAVYNENTMLCFNNDRNLGAYVINTPVVKKGFERIAQNHVQGVRIDDVVNEKVDLIAMDIEGSECEALQGASRLIMTYKPKLAISCYHKIDDFLKIPQLILELNPQYELYIRHHCSTTNETVVYAI